MQRGVDEAMVKDMVESGQLNSNGSPSEARRSERRLVGAAGLELAASWSQTRRSSQLSYAPNKKSIRNS